MHLLSTSEHTYTRAATISRGTVSASSGSLSCIVTTKLFFSIIFGGRPHQPRLKTYFTIKHGSMIQLSNLAVLFA